MDPKTAHTIVQRIILVLTVIWCLFLLPSLILFGFALEGYLNFPTDNPTVKQILYYNILFFPFILIISLTTSWLCFIQKKHWPAIICMFLPLVTFFVEIIAADIALFLS